MIAAFSDDDGFVGGPFGAIELGFCGALRGRGCRIPGVSCTRAEITGNVCADISSASNALAVDGAKLASLPASDITKSTSFPSSSSVFGVLRWP